MTERAALYARVSTDVQRQNYSIPSQLKAMVEYAHDRGLTIVGDRFIDPVSGQDLQSPEGSILAYVDDFTSSEFSRPGLNDSLSFLKNVGFGVLIVHALDRLARDPYIRQTIEREIASLGAKVEYVLGNYEESAEGEVRKDLDAVFAKWENTKRVERSSRGKMRKAEMGLFACGRPPYGYRYDPDALAGLAVYEPEAEVVQAIFDMYVNRKMSIAQIAKELNARGIETAKKYRDWNASAIAHILKYTAYVGFVYYNKTKIKDGRQIRREKSEWVKITCTPLVPEAIFEAARDLLNYNKEYRRKHPKRFYLLSGMVFCSECECVYAASGAYPSIENHSPRQWYRHRISQGHCSNQSFPAKKLEPMVWQQVTQILLNPKSLRRGYEKMMAEEEGKFERQMRHLEVLRNGIEKLEAKKKVAGRLS